MLSMACSERFTALSLSTLRCEFRNAWPIVVQEVLDSHTPHRCKVLILLWLRHLDRERKMGLF